MCSITQESKVFHRSRVILTRGFRGTDLFAAVQHIAMRAIEPLLLNLLLTGSAFRGIIHVSFREGSRVSALWV
jgi:hypothetical protein